MQKRKSPLELKQVTETSLNKRTNPLELKNEEVIANPAFNIKSQNVPFDIENALKVKRKLTITKISKVLLDTLKETNPGKKTGILLEQAILRYLYEETDKYQEVTEKLLGKDTKL